MFQFLRNNLPNFLTCLNLTCGFIGIVLISEDGLIALETVKWLLVLAGIADFVDGFVARLLKSASSIGKDLDSLADGITFGVLPGLVCFHYLKSLTADESESNLLPWVALLIPVFSVVRLAIFNNDSSQSDEFKGVPTPANAFFLVFLVLAFQSPHFFTPISAIGFALIVLATSILLVSRIPLMALKFKDFSINRNKGRFFLIGLSVGSLAYFGQLAVPLIFIFYIGISILVNLLRKHAV